jgi:magnesium-transporting ATPase (P-type)
VSWVVLKKKESFSIRSYVFIFLALVFSIVVSWFIIANAQSDNPAVYYGLLVIPVGMVVYYFMKKASR